MVERGRLMTVEAVKTLEIYVTSLEKYSLEGLIRVEKINALYQNISKSLD